MKLKTVMDWKAKSQKASNYINSDLMQTNTF